MPPAWPSASGTDLEELRTHWRADRQWEPQWNAARRDEAYRGWQKAVERAP